MSKAKPRHVEPPESPEDRQARLELEAEAAELVPGGVPPVFIDGVQVAPASKPLEPAEPGPIEDETPAPEPIPGVSWPRDCTVEIPLCLLGQRRLNACESEEDAVARYHALCAGLKSKHAPIVRVLQSLTLE